MSDAIEQRPLSPEARAFGAVAGRPVALADGNTWRLAAPGLRRGLDDVRDRLHDDAILGGKVDMKDVREAAWLLLWANYDMTTAEGLGLIVGAEPQALADAVLDSLFGPPEPRRTWSVWARSALLANGLDPESIPDADRNFVLEQLVSTGRAIPLAEFDDAAVAAKQRRALFEGISGGLGGDD